MTLEIGDDESRARPHVLREYALLADGYRGVLVGPGRLRVDVRAPLGLRRGVLLAGRAATALMRSPPAAASCGAGSTRTAR